MIKIEQNPKLGYYTVGQEKFYSKPMALTKATETNQFPEWNFSNETFGAQNWLIEPNINILDLYRIRAQQLRDKYDYIRLEFSGGGDSTTALYSFINNGIHLDEDAIIDYCRTKLARYKCPSKVLFVDALPRNLTGKVQRFALR